MFRLPHLVLIATMTAAFGGCVSQEQYRRSLADNDNLRSQRDAQQDYLKGLEADNASLRSQLGALQQRVPDVQWIEDQKRRIADILQRFGGDGLPDGVSFEVGNAEGPVLRIEGEVLFASGKAELTAEGQRTLQQLSSTLADQQRKLRVEGHTDNDPIVHSQWGTNLRLSVARALSVSEFLEKSGVPRERLAVAGYGEFAPKVGNDSSEGKRTNRRVEILIRNESS